jgi:hypothetical protein
VQARLASCRRVLRRSERAVRGVDGEDAVGGGESVMGRGSRYKLSYESAATSTCEQSERVGQRRERGVDVSSESQITRPRRWRGRERRISRHALPWQRAARIVRRERADARGAHEILGVRRGCVRR